MKEGWPRNTNEELFSVPQERLKAAPGEPEVDQDRRDALKFIAALGSAFIARSVEAALPGFIASESGPRSPERDIEGRIAREVETAKAIIRNPDRSRILGNPYLVSCVYYSEQFFGELDRESRPAEPSKRIVKALRPHVTPEVRASYFAFFQETARRGMKPGAGYERVSPLQEISFGKGENHKDAIDLFAPEGSPVRSMTSGLVLLAENGWRADDPFSTSSVKGGNQVIVFDPIKSEMQRYCHLRATPVKARMIVEAGHVIGTVGNTGKNASRPGHGGHLHFEINKYLATRQEVERVTEDLLKSRLERLG